MVESLADNLLLSGTAAKVVTIGRIANCGMVCDFKWMLIGQVNKSKGICSSHQVNKQGTCAHTPAVPKATRSQRDRQARAGLKGCQQHMIVPQQREHNQVQQRRG